MANESRGEVEIDLDGKTWPMRPEYQTIREIEHAIGMSAPEMIDAVLDRRARLEQIAKAIALGIGATRDDAPSVDEVGNLLLRQGTNSVVPALVAFLASVPGGERAKNLVAPLRDALARTAPDPEPAADAPSPGGA